MALEVQKGPRPEDIWPTLEGYEIVEVIGRGSSGIVYRARQLAVEREVAIKMLHPAKAGDPRVVRRLQREARTTARLAHPHIVSAVDMGESGGRWWYAMEYVDGPSLAERLRQEGRLREREALRLFIPLCEALEHLAEHGVVHRDIKPANILIDRSSGARLADLGLAFAEDDPSITGTGGTLGTPHYISPEQAVDPRKADLRSDIWSFGATLFHTVCGRPPFAGESAAEVLSGVLYGRIPDPLELEPGLSKRLALVLRKCLVRDPAQRYQTPRELLADLERVRERRSPRVLRRALDPVARGPAYQRRLRLAVLAAALVLVPSGVYLALRLVRRAGQDALAEAGRTGPFAPLDELAARLSLGGVSLAELRAELDGLLVVLPPEAGQRTADLARELDERLRRTTRAVRDELENELERELSSGDLAAAWETLERELEPRFQRATGYRLAELSSAGINLEPWRSRLALELEENTEARVSELEAALQDWRGERLLEVEAELAQQHWASALELLAPPERQSLLREAGQADLRLPEPLVAGLIEDLALEFRLRSRRIQDEWSEQDRQLRAFVVTRRATLEGALRAGPPRIAAADMLREDFERQLFDQGLARAQMPPGLPQAGLDELERSVLGLLELEEHLLEEDARAGFAELEELGAFALRQRSYASARELWEEYGARLAAAPRFATSEARAELARRAHLRAEEARLLEDLLQRVATRVSALDGQRIELRWGNITYPEALLSAGPDPLRDGFRAEGIAGNLTIAELPVAQLETFGDLLGDEAALAPEQRLVLALLRFHEQRPREAQRALFAGALPLDPPWNEIGSELSHRIATALEREDQRAQVREEEARRLLEGVFDADLQQENPRMVRARLARLFDDYEDLPLVRQRRSELLRLRERLDQPRAGADEAEFEHVFQPDELKLSPLGRVTLRYDFGEGRLGAWEAGDWVYDGLGFVRPPGATVAGWLDLGREAGLRLALRPPLVVDTFELVLRVEQLQSSGPPRCLWFSAAGFQVALVGPGVAGGERAGRFLVGTDEPAAFLARLAAGEGKRATTLLVPGGPAHELRFRGQPRAGRCEFWVDGLLLAETSGLRAPAPDARALVIRSWEPVRVTGVTLEGDRQ